MYKCKNAHFIYINLISDFVCDLFRRGGLSVAHKYMYQIANNMVITYMYGKYAMLAFVCMTKHMPILMHVFLSVPVSTHILIWYINVVSTALCSFSYNTLLYLRLLDAAWRLIEEIERNKVQ